MQIKNGQSARDFHFNENVCVKIAFHLDESLIDRTELGYRVVDQKERIVFTTTCKVSDFKKQKDGSFELISIIPANILVPNTYKLIVALHIPNQQMISYLEDKVSFTIEETGTDFYMYAGNDYGCVFLDCEWRNF